MKPIIIIYIGRDRYQNHQGSVGWNWNLGKFDNALLSLEIPTDPMIFWEWQWNLNTKQRRWLDTFSWFSENMTGCLGNEIAPENMPKPKKGKAYPFGNWHIPLEGSFEVDFPFPQVGYVSSLQGKSQPPLFFSGAKSLLVVLGRAMNLAKDFRYLTWRYRTLQCCFRCGVALP